MNAEESCMGIDRDMVEQWPVVNDEPCRKCGTLGPALVHNAKVDNRGLYDWLDATCWRCGYSWNVRPLDAAKP